MNLVDVLLLLMVVLFALLGWRQGFVQGLLSFVGFLGGGLLGAFVVPPLLDGRDLAAPVRAMVVVLGVFACAALGQVLTSLVGRELRGRITWHPARVVDNAGGAVLNVLSLAVVAWIVASAVVVMPQGLSVQLRQSQVLAGLDALVPDAVRDLFARARDLLDTTGFPRVFSGFDDLQAPEVAAGDPALLDSPAVRSSWGSLVRVKGFAAGCDARVTGSGFVYAPGRVMTNAHVVAGIDRPVVQVRGTGPELLATPVYVDPRTDVAVLAVAGLDAPSLAFDANGTRGSAAVVAGFPGGGPLTVGAARIRAEVTARGEDIYGNSGVTRQVFAFRGVVRPGNSGGPLLDAAGDVYGVVFAAAVDDANTGYALTADQVSAAAAAGRTATVAVPTGSCRTE